MKNFCYYLLLIGVIAFSAASCEKDTSLEPNNSNIIPADNADTTRITMHLKGLGKSNYLARWTAAHTLETGILYDNGTNVGIGLANPTCKLQVAGKISASDAYGPAIYGFSQGGTGVYGSGNRYGVHAVGSDAMSTGVFGEGNINGVYGKGNATGVRGEGEYGIYGKGYLFAGYFDGKGYFSDNVGIGTTTPGFKLTVVGEIGATGFVQSSDRNLKQDIQTLDNSLEKILSLRGVSFNWKSNNKPSLGLIAQEVERVYPELVTSQSGVMGVQYANLVGPLIEAIKSQQALINCQQEQITSLQEQNKIFNERLKKLELQLVAKR